MKHSFCITRTAGDVKSAVETVLAGIELPAAVGGSVFIKPNFTFPRFEPGVTTTREVIVALISSLRDLGYSRICLGEGEGGYNAFSMDQTFQSYGMSDLSQQFGLEVVNVRTWPSLDLDVQSGRGSVVVRVPRPVFDEFDCFITIPVPKVHSMTTISCAVKNQWGLIQDTMRLQYHYYFNEVITAINSRIPNAFAIVDGTFGLTRNGPMIEGMVLDLGWIAGCNNIYLNDRFIARVMGFDLSQISHLKYADRLQLMPAFEDSRVLGEVDKFVDERFYLERNIWNRMAKVTWYSRSMSRLVYSSKFSSVLHRLMYSIRQRPADLEVKGFDW